MRFTLTFLIASNLLTASLVWFYTSETQVSQPEIVPVVEVEPEPAKNAIIEYFSMPNCRQCINFKRSGIIRELEAKGWTVVKTDEGRSAPTFTVWVNGKSASFTSYSSKSRFFRTLKSKMKDLQDANRR